MTDDPTKKNVVIQVKHYINSRFSDLITSLKKEVSKVEELLPSEYYICCAVHLTAANKTEIYNMFTPRCHVYGMLDRAKLLTVLLTEKYDAFYHTHDYLSDDAVTSMLENMDFEDFCDLNKEIKKAHVDLIYRRYRDAFVSEINRSVSEYLETFDADTYYCDYDMNDLFMTNTTYNGLYNQPDIDKIVETIREYVKDDVYDAVTDKLRSFPSEIIDSIKISRSGIYVDTNDIGSYVLGYMEPDDADYEYHGSGGSGISGDVDVLDLIFKNH